MRQLENDSRRVSGIQLKQTYKICMVGRTNATHLEPLPFVEQAANELYKLVKVNFTRRLVAYLISIGLIGRREVPHFRTHLHEPDDTSTPASERQLCIFGNETRPTGVVSLPNYYCASTARMLVT